jgi:hypothetical protein
LGSVSHSISDTVFMTGITANSTADTDSHMGDRPSTVAAGFTVVDSMAVDSTAAGSADTWAAAAADKQKQQHRYSAAVFRTLS